MQIDFGIISLCFPFSFNLVTTENVKSISITYNRTFFDALSSVWGKCYYKNGSRIIILINLLSASTKNRKTIKSTSNITPINKTLDNDVMKHKRIPYIHVNYQLRLIVER